MSQAASDLPPGWAWTTLGDVTWPRGERGNPRESPTSRFVGLEHVEAHTARLLGHVPAGSMSSTAHLFRRGDVLYGRLRSYLNKVWLADFDGMCSSEFIVLPENEAVAGAFLRHRLNALDFVSFAEHQTEGDRPRVDFGQIASFPVLLPPFPDQRRIVAKIEELFSQLDAGVEELKKARVQLKRYRQSVLKAAFGFLPNTKTHHAPPTVKLADCTQLITKGESPKWQGFDYVADGIPFIRSENVLWGRIDMTGAARVPRRFHEKLKRSHVLPRDVLINLVGASIGRSGVVPDLVPEANVNQAVAVIRTDETLAPSS